MQHERCINKSKEVALVSGVRGDVDDERRMVEVDWMIECQPGHVGELSG
jgi:hypothetical protein